MPIESQVTIRGTKEDIWKVITNIENAADTISGIDQIEILEKPDDGLVGLKWKETRTLFGKAATEIMWIAEAVENDSYKTHAESHGCKYVCSFTITENGDQCTLTMSHQTQPLSIMSKIVSVPMGLLFKGTFRKLLTKDLEDIKAAVEGNVRQLILKPNDQASRHNGSHLSNDVASRMTDQRADGEYTLIANTRLVGASKLFDDVSQSHFPRELWHRAPRPTIVSTL